MRCSLPVPFETLRLIAGVLLAALLLTGVAATPVLADDDDKKTEAAESPSDDDEKEDEEEEKDEEKKSDAKSDGKDDAKDEDDDKGDDEDDDKGDDEDDEKKEKKKPAKKRKTTKVESKPLKVEVTVDGSFVARTMTPVTLQPEAWSSFKIEEIVPHGAKVRQGEVLVKFEEKKLDEEIESLELSQRLTDLSIRKAEEELPRVEKSLEMALTDAKQLHERVNSDYKRYKEQDRERFIEQINMSLKMSKRSLNYAKDELEQLEKMYEADDLTEETEEIILTRQRQQVEMAEYYYKNAKIRHDEMLNIYLPRQDVDNKEAVDRVDMTLQRAKLASQIDLNRARYELEQKKISRDKSVERHAKLVQDRGLMEVKSPAEGLVYYGRCVNGKWADMTSMLGKLLPTKSVPSGTTMMTIVDPEEMYLQATVGEKERPTIKVGQAAKIMPAGEGAEPLEGKVASVSLIPVSSGKFALEIDVTDEDRPDWLVPGMTGKIKIVTYDKKSTLLVDKKAIKTDEDDETKKYVWEIEEEDGEVEVEKEYVKLGKTKGDLVEILKGVDEGDVLSLEDEEEETDDDDDDEDEDDDN
ncbi:MAG: HlyD family efflux transporter periplasmic adaptor subunit [Planctomycetota bacterium]